MQKGAVPRQDDVNVVVKDSPFLRWNGEGLTVCFMFSLLSSPSHILPPFPSFGILSGCATAWFSFFLLLIIGQKGMESTAHQRVAAGVRTGHNNKLTINLQIISDFLQDFLWISWNINI